ncbi:hypothetical protein DRO58_09590 [Candidatus Bathyarchaeota archaeon]|nr:MAG: hypothetical protein DRO58_09590 [Candidatus Bathyarchaeota archaeon]
MAANYHNFLWFIVFTSLDSISYTWLYNSTDGSLLTVSLYHPSINASNIILFAESRVSSSIFPFYFLTVAILTSILCFIFLNQTLYATKIRFSLNHLKSL